MNYRKIGHLFLLTALFSVRTVLVASCSSALHSTDLAAFTLSPDGTKVAAAANDGTVFWWDVKSGIRTTLVDCLYASAIIFSPNSSQVALGDAQGTIHIFDLSNRHLIQSLGADMSHADTESGANLGSVDQITFSADGNRLASHDLTGVRVWALNEGKELMSISDERRVEQIALNRDGTLLARGGYGWLALWDVPRIQAVKTIALQPGESVESLIFSRDDHWIISAQSGQEISIWDNKTGEKIRTLRGQTGHLSFPLIITPSDSLLSAGDDGTLRLWDLGAGQPKEMWRALPGIISTDGRFLLRSSSQPGRLELWRIGDPLKNVQPFNYRSPLCPENVSAEGTDAGGKQLGGLQIVGMGESRASDGTHLSFTTYVAPDCKTVTIMHGTFTSPSNAEKELDLQAGKAARVIEKGRNKDFLGNNLGGRALLVFAETDGAPTISAAIWTDGNRYAEIVSSSLPLVQSLEKHYRH